MGQSLSIVKTEPIPVPLHIVSQAPIGTESMRPAGLPAGMELPGVAAHAPANMPDGNNALDIMFANNPGTGKPGGYAEHLRVVGNAGRRMVRDAGGVVAHPLDTLNAMTDPRLLSPMGPGSDNLLQQQGQHYLDTAKTQGWSQAASDMGGDAMFGEMSGGMLKGAGSTLPGDAAALRTAAIGDPDAAALRGLQVGPKSPKALGTIQSVQGARPFLQGASSLEDLQSKIQPAKDEIWGPYQQAVDAIGERPVMGPDGITMVRDLEAQRSQLSALNRGLKSGSPEAIQLAQQKGMTAAQLLDQEKAVQAALDPELASTGIDPQSIRKTFGNVAQVDGKISGKSTLIEKPQPYGLGKFADSVAGFDATKAGTYLRPLKSLFYDVPRDLAAGRPLWSGAPTDVAIKDAFANAGPKPDFGQFQMPTPKGLLPEPTLDDSPWKLGDPWNFGVPSRTAITPEPPATFPRLPAAASDGELKPMIWPKANPYPDLAGDFARTRIVPSRGKIPSTTLPSEHEGLMLGAGERLGLPADVGEQTIDPRFLQKQSYPALNTGTAIEKTPTVFAPKQPGMLNGLFTAGGDGHIMPERKGLPAPKAKTKR